MSVPDHDPDLEYVDRNAADKLADREHRAPLEDMPTGSFTSSNVHSALYDFGERELYCRYLRDGPDATYRYDDVSAREWQGLQAAASKGSYINANIAFEYQYTKLQTIDFDIQSVQSPYLRRFLSMP